MLRKALLAAALLASTLSTSAYSGDYIEGRVIGVIPHISLSFGSLPGFRVEYEVGGHRYFTHSQRHPGRVILVPPPYRVIPVGPAFGHRHNHWRDDQRRGWNNQGRWDDRRHWRGDDRGRGRGHGRH
jgi:hypothetical protein